MQVVSIVIAPLVSGSIRSEIIDLWKRAVHAVIAECVLLETKQPHCVILYQDDTTNLEALHTYPEIPITVIENLYKYPEYCKACIESTTYLCGYPDIGLGWISKKWVD